MENVDTVDVSWLHHTQRGNRARSTSTPTPPSPSKRDTLPPKPPITRSASSAKPPTTEANGSSVTKPQKPSTPTMATGHFSKQRKGNQEVDGSKDQAQQQGNSQTGSGNAPKSAGSKPISTSRRNSWISNLSSKFSSGSTPPSQSPLRDAAGGNKPQGQGQRPDLHNPFGAAFSPGDKSEKKDDSGSSFTSHSPKGQSSFLHNAFRRFSSGGGGLGRIANQGHVCQERRVMNVDQNRDRCKVPELNPAKLRRVAFCVDVEIAGTSRRSESEEEEAAPPPAPAKKDKASKKADPKAMDKSEGAALKSSQHDTTNGGPGDGAAPGTSPESPLPDLPGEAEKPEGQTKEPTRKQEKKKKSNEERKERKEKRRRQAEANGSIPLQFTREDGRSTSGRRVSKGQDQPTTDPVRIYRRCCQLRESAPLKKLVDEMTSPSSTLAEAPGTVAVLDLTGYSMSLPDIMTFSDWLAIVPVRKLILQNCNLTDEAVRIILAGLLSTKTMEESRNRRLRIKRSKDSNEPVQIEKFGAIEKLSLKDNPKIGHEGWRHISLFIHLSRCLKGIDLSGIPFPKAPGQTNGPPSPVAKAGKPLPDISTVFAAALSERFAGDHLEELVISECYPSTEDIGRICGAARTVGLRRLGVANNSLTREGLEHIVEYFKAGHCEGLDLGGNDIKDHLGLFATAIQKELPLISLSLADCSLTPKTLSVILQALPILHNFRFIDLSHNPGLFAAQPNSMGMLRRYLPQMPELKRIHLADVNLTSEDAIALAEIIPDCRKLCHINILENPALQALAAAKDAASQEEACAFYASLMTAARISRTLYAVDIDVPTDDNNEVVKALASQIVAYSLHNLERAELVSEYAPSSDTTVSEKEVPIPDILLRIVGHTGNEAEDPGDADQPPDEDYVIGGTGVVKALGVCLGNTDVNPETPRHSPSPSGASTPLRRLSQDVIHKKPRDMSKDLLNSARRIRVRLQPALIREDRAGNDGNYRRLQFLDTTLQRMIERFEDRFPETRLSSDDDATKDGLRRESSINSSLDETVTRSDELNDSTTAAEASGLGQSPPDVDAETALEDDEADVDQYAVRLSRASSNTSLHSKALTSEEGEVHRFSQNLRRDILDTELQDPEEANPQLHDDEQMAALREKLEKLRGSEIQSRIETVGVDKALEELGASLEELVALQRQDPEAFTNFKESQIATEINAGLRTVT